MSKLRTSLRGILPPPAERCHLFPLVSCSNGLRLNNIFVFNLEKHLSAYEHLWSACTDTHFTSIMSMHLPVFLTKSAMGLSFLKGHDEEKYFQFSWKSLRIKYPPLFNVQVLQTVKWRHSPSLQIAKCRHKASFLCFFMIFLFIYY